MATNLNIVRIILSLIPSSTLLSCRQQVSTEKCPSLPAQQAVLTVRKIKNRRYIK